MPIRLAIHVGPHKTGSTSAQRALAAARERLASDGVWYPESVPGAQWPEQHADAWRLLGGTRQGEFDAWLDGARKQAAERGCDTVFLSSENFHSPGTRRALDRILSGWRRRTGGETRLLYVQRDLVDLACSRARSHLAGEAGFYFHHRYDLRRWARHFAIAQIRSERWFRRRQARFVPLAADQDEGLAARLLAAATDRPFPGIVTGVEHVTASRLSDVVGTLSYGLRVMHHYATGEDVNVPSAFVATRALLRAQRLDTPAFARLAEGFDAGVRREVETGIADFRRLSPLARAWSVWFERIDRGGHLRG